MQAFSSRVDDRSNSPVQCFPEPPSDCETGADVLPEFFGRLGLSSVEFVEVENKER
jgi:hypothetical protein